MGRDSGKANDIIGAVTDNPAQQLKGEVQKVVGRIQEKVGRATGEKPKRRPGR